MTASAVFLAVAVICVAVLLKTGVISCGRKTTGNKLTVNNDFSEQSAPLRDGDPVRMESSL